MRILQVHNFYRIPGGECGVVHAEKSLLESRGHDVRQYTRHSSEVSDYGAVRKARAYIQIPYSFEVERDLVRALRREQPDVVHVHNVFPLLSPSVYRAIKKQNIPVVQTVHNFRFLCPNGQFFVDGRVCLDCMERGLWSAVHKRCMQNSYVVSLAYATAIGMAWASGNLPDNIDQFVALNRFSADKLSAGGIPADKISICGNYIDEALSSVTPKRAYVLYLGRLSREKGLLTLLHAWKGVEGVALKVAGTGPLEAELRDTAKTLGLSRVEFVGYVSGPEKENLVREALCTVVPSEWYENFPLTILEAYALGTSVIASRIGGLPEMVEHGNTGLLFEPGNSDELSRCISGLVSNRDEVRRMATNALDAAKKRFGPDQHYRQLVAIYSRAIEAKQRVSV